MKKERRIDANEYASKFDLFNFLVLCLVTSFFLDSTKEGMCELTVVLSTEPASDVSRNYCSNKEIVII